MVKFWNFSPTDAGEVELRIAGEIVDDDSAWIYEWFGIPAASPNAFRQELSKYSSQNITVWIDSWGGDTTAAAGIYNALKEHKGKVTVKIDGKAVSAASVIAMAGDVIQMSPVAVMMIHNPWTSVSGEAKDMRRVADVLDVVKDTIINAYQLKTGKSRDKISEMMDNETYMSAQTAKTEGFADEILYQDSEATDKKVENSFMLSRLAIQNSASASMRKFIENFRDELKNEEDPDMQISTIEDLKNQKPDLYNQVKNDVLVSERSRITALDALDDPTNAALHEIINDAKASGKTAEEIQSVVNILKRHAAEPAAPQNEGIETLKNIIQDNKQSGVDKVVATGADSHAEGKEKDAAGISFMASVINKKNGRDK